MVVLYIKPIHLMQHLFKIVPVLIQHLRIIQYQTDIVVNYLLCIYVEDNSVVVSHTFGPVE